MKYIDYKEHKDQGTFNFPVAFYHESPQSPRYYMPLHWHPEYEIIRIISGTFHLTVDNSSLILNPGDIVFLSDGSLHGGTPRDCVYECIVFDLNVLLRNNHACAKTIHDILDGKMIVNTLLSENSPNILPIVESLSNSLSRKGTGYEFVTQGCLYILFGIILEDHLYKEVSDSSISVSRMNSIKNVLDYISENYYNNIGLDDLARIAGMNPKYFCRYFRSMTERTPIDYLNYFRVECSCEMLSTRDISVQEAAISCGFNDESYFIKTFHKYKGVTPKQYLKKKF